MPTPDRFPGAREEELIELKSNSDSLTVDGQFKFDAAGNFLMRDNIGNFDPRSGGGISESQHKALKHLIHFIDEGPGDGFGTPCTKTVTGGIFPTSIVWADSSGNNIIEKLIERSAGPATNVKPTPVKWKVYDGAGNATGNVLFTITDDITYSGVIETSRSRTIVAGDA